MRVPGGLADNVVRLADGYVPGDATPEIVELLERLLAEARDGKLLAIAFAAVNDRPGDGHSIASGWELAPGTKWDLAASVLTLHSRFSMSMADR